MKPKIFGIALLLTLTFIGSRLAAQKFPAFSFTDLQGNAFTQDQLETDKAIIAIFFDPYCDHCTQQADWIVESADLFKDVQMIWVTTELLEPTLEFYEAHFKDSGLKDIHFLLDKDFMFDSYFGYSEVPSIYIYDKNWKRIKALSKETPADKLLEIINKKR